MTNGLVGIEWGAKIADRYSVFRGWEYLVAEIRRVLGLYRRVDGPSKERMFLSSGCVGKS